MKLFSKVATLAMSVVAVASMTVGVTCGVAFAGDANDTDETFKVVVDGKEIKDIVKNEDAWSYTDYSTGNVNNVPVYSVAVPWGTTQATISFEMPRLVYNYNEPDVYLAGAVEDVTKGMTEVTVTLDSTGSVWGSDEIVPSDGNPDFIQVQRTYNSDYSDGTLLYVVTFTFENAQQNLLKVNADLEAAKREAETAKKEAAVAKEALAKSVKSVTVNSRTVDATAISVAIAKAGGNAKYVTSVTLGKNVKTVKGSAFKSLSKVKTVTVKTKKLTKKSVKNFLKSSKVKTIKVSVGSKKLNKKYVKTYKKVFAKKISGKKVAIK